MAYDESGFDIPEEHRAPLRGLNLPDDEVLRGFRGRGLVPIEGDGTGIPGPKGDKGDKGDTGEPGPKGDKGDPGGGEGGEIGTGLSYDEDGKIKLGDSKLTYLASGPVLKHHYIANTFGSPYSARTESYAINNQTTGIENASAGFSSFLYDDAIQKSFSVSAVAKSTGNSSVQLVHSVIFINNPLPPTVKRSSVELLSDQNGNNAKMLVVDGHNSRGLEDGSDYSANKTGNSYITPNWIKAQPGYNPSVAQYFTHDSTGAFVWVNIP